MLTRYLQTMAWTAAAFGACLLIAGDQLTLAHAATFGALTGIDPVRHPDLLQTALAIAIMGVFAVGLPVLGFPVWLAGRAFSEARDAVRGNPAATRASLVTAAACGAVLALCLPAAFAIPVLLAWDALMMAGVAAAGWNLMRSARENRHAR